jgi:uncharacterized protein (TIGR02284 family)
METLTSNRTVERLNDLVQINNDRIKGYEKALRELKPEDSDLKAFFLHYVDQSRKIKLQLGQEVQTSGGNISNHTTAGGRIYRAWADVKAVFSGYNRRTILSNCEAGESAALRAYDMGLDSAQLPGYIRDLLLRQKERLYNALEEIRALRNQES